MFDGRRRLRFSGPHAAAVALAAGLLWAASGAGVVPALSRGEEVALAATVLVCAGLALTSLASAIRAATADRRSRWARERRWAAAATETGEISEAQKREFWLAVIEHYSRDSRGFWSEDVDGRVARSPNSYRYAMWGKTRQDEVITVRFWLRMVEARGRVNLDVCGSYFDGSPWGYRMDRAHECSAALRAIEEHYHRGYVRGYEAGRRGERFLDWEIERPPGAGETPLPGEA
ncbi:MAG TPA: hypothetical protein VF744_16330 [Beijerinckiaceae bacterium]|jgi:hypothetical protein